MEREGAELRGVKALSNENIRDSWELNDDNTERAQGREVKRGDACSWLER